MKSLNSEPTSTTHHFGEVEHSVVFGIEVRLFEEGHELRVLEERRVVSLQSKRIISGSNTSQTLLRERHAFKSKSRRPVI